MLTLKLYPIEFRGLMQHLYHETFGQHQVPLGQQSVIMLLLLEYMNTWSRNRERITAWGFRSPKKQYRLSLKLPLAKALYDSLQSTANRSDLEQLFLNKLDHAIVNYQNPNQANPYPHLAN